jgi:hypothetical protein
VKSSLDKARRPENLPQERSLFILENYIQEQIACALHKEILPYEWLRSVQGSKLARVPSQTLPVFVRDPLIYQWQGSIGPPKHYVGVYTMSCDSSVCSCVAMTIIPGSIPIIQIFYTALMTRVTVHGGIV